MPVRPGTEPDKDHTYLHILLQANYIQDNRPLPNRFFLLVFLPEASRIFRVVSIN